MLPFQQLVDFSGFRKFWEGFDLPELGSFGWWRIKRILSNKVNAKAKKKRTAGPEPIPSRELDELEREVIERVRSCN